jgi:hypothetical protein
VAVAAGALAGAAAGAAAFDAGLFTVLAFTDRCLRLLPKVPLVILPFFDLTSPLPMVFFFRG